MSDANEKNEPRKPMSDEEAGEILYGSAREPKSFAPVKAPPPIVATAHPPVGGLAFEKKLQTALYGEEQDENYAKTDGQGRIENLIRDVDSRVMFRSFDNTRESMISQYSKALANADLRNMELPTLHEGDLRGSNCRGATLHDVRGCDLRGMLVDSSTDISQADFAGCRIDIETFDELVKCKGFKQAKRLGRPLKAT